MHCVEVRGSSVYVGLMWRGRRSRPSPRGTDRAGLLDEEEAGVMVNERRFLTGTHGEGGTVTTSWQECGWIPKNFRVSIKPFLLVRGLKERLVRLSLYSAVLNITFWFLKSSTDFKTVHEIWEKRSRFSTCSKNLTLNKEACWTIKVQCKIVTISHSWNQPRGWGTFSTSYFLRCVQTTVLWLHAKHNLLDRRFLIIILLSIISHENTTSYFCCF